MPHKRINWEPIEIDYIQGIQIEENGELTHIYPTYKELAARYEIDINTVAQRSKKQEWVKKKKYYQHKLGEHRKENSFKMFVSESAIIDYRNVSLIKSMQSLIQVWLRPYEEYYLQNIASEEEKEDYNIADIAYGEEEREIPKINVKEIREAVTTIDLIHNLSRKIHGEPVNSDDLRKEIDSIKKAKEDDTNKDLENKIKKQIAELGNMEKKQELLRQKKLLSAGRKEIQIIKEDEKEEIYIDVEKEDI